MTRKQEPSKSPRIQPSDWFSGRRLLYAAALAIVLFYWTPVVDRGASIQWDAVDVHYPSQRYFAEEVLAGRLPHWTPFIFSGFPFLSDPQVGAFYPLNWPFFLMGVTPWSIQLELLLHAMLAVAGAYLLFSRLTARPAAALTGALAYGLGGFFAAHSSHVGMFQGAALFPWMLYFAHRGLESSLVRWASAAALAAGGIILAGHLQTALYAVLALGIYLIVQTIQRPAAWSRAALILAATAAFGATLAAIVALPGMQLTAESIRATFDFSKGVEGALPLDALGTLVHPNAMKSLTGPYQGQADVTQTYFYSGLLLLPLAFLGASKRPGWMLGAGLVLLPAWYMLGPVFGLYHIGGLVPYLHQMRAPVNGWFIAAFGLAALAAFGICEAERRWRKPWLGIALLGIFILDLCLVNSWVNPLAFGRFNYADVFGKREQMQSEVIAGLLQGTRVDLPPAMPLFGPLNATLIGGIPSTSGYNPLELRAYSEYRNAARSNVRLTNGLSAIVVVDHAKGALIHNDKAVPMISFPKSVRRVSSRAESQGALGDLDPMEHAVVEGLAADRATQPAARLTKLNVSFSSVSASYESPAEAFATISVPFYPGWGLAIDGKPSRIYRTNHALMGAMVPAGSHSMELAFAPERFQAGMGLSIGALLFLVLGVISPGPLKRW